VGLLAIVAQFRAGRHRNMIGAVFASVAGIG
jgi:hypothetical protein